MLGDFFNALALELIGELVFYLIIIPAGLLLLFILINVFSFFKWIYTHIKAGIAATIRFFKGEKKDIITEESETISEMSSATVDDMAFYKKRNDY